MTSLQAEELITTPRLVIDLDDMKYWLNKNDFFNKYIENDGFGLGPRMKRSLFTELYRKLSSIN